jgi:hypothetical protein
MSASINPKRVKAAIKLKQAMSNFNHAVGLENNHTILERDFLSSFMDPFLSFDGKRDYYTSFGYPKGLLYYHFYRMWRRQDLAKRIINAYPDATWRDKPSIYEKDKQFDDKNEFNDKWRDLAKRTKIYTKFLRGDKLSRIGRYSIIFLGFNDIKNMSELNNPVNNPTNINYIMPRGEGHAEIIDYINDPTDPRYGLPKTYKVTFSSSDYAQGSQLFHTANVHHTRILHLAEDLAEDEVFALPTLEAVYNRFVDMQKVVGGSAEMFWQGAFPGFNFSADADAELTSTSKDEMSQEIDEYMHGMRRYLRLQGIKVDSLDPQVSSPKEHYDVLMKIIAGTTGIPLRVLTGSERGEMSSEQDEKNWLTAVDQRRRNYAEPFILGALIDRLQEHNILPDVEYEINWPDIYAPSDKDKANIIRIQTESLANYARTPEAMLVIPPDVYLTEFLGASPGLMNKIKAGRNDEFVELLKEEMENVAHEKTDIESVEEELPVTDRKNATSEVARDRQGRR